MLKINKKLFRRIIFLLTSILYLESSVCWAGSSGVKMKEREYSWNSLLEELALLLEDPGGALLAQSLKKHSLKKYIKGGFMYAIIMYSIM